MGKNILISGLLVVLALGMNSCKKCYVCTQTITESVYSVVDSTVYLKTEVCSGKNGTGSRTNLNATIQDMEANNYICVAQ